MAGKRTKTQLTADAALREESSSDEEPVDLPSKASAQVMAGRKIAKLKTRAKPANGGVNSSKPLGVFGMLNSKTEEKTEPASSNPFGAFSSQKSTPSDKPTQLKSLNAIFLQSINNSLTKNPIANLKPILAKYEEYFDKVEANKIEVRNPEVPKVDVKPVQKDEYTSQFSFTPAEKPVGKPVEKPEAPVEVASESSDSEDEVEIKGPVFQVQELPKSRDYGFKFGKAPPPDSDSEDEVKIQGPTFKLPTGTQIKDSAFKLPQKSETKAETAENATEKPAEAPKFSFGTEKSTEAPKFSFGNAATASAPAASAFSFGSAKKEEPAKPAFQFTATPSSGFSFGSQPKEEQKKEEPTTIAPFKFGNSEPAKTEPVSEPKTAFSGFNFSASAAPTSVFSFGGDKPSANGNPFSFGSSAPSTDAKPAASTFNFSFSAPKTEATATADGTADGTTDTTADEPENTDDVKGDFAVVKLTQKVETKTGEENETLLYVKKSKILKFDPENKSDPYTTVGLGELKVLKNNETGKSRILVRSEGSNNVLLNTLIVKDVKYDLIGKGNTLRIPTVTSNGLETFIARVKTPADGTELLEKVINSQDS